MAFLISFKQIKKVIIEGLYEIYHFTCILFDLFDYHPYFFKIIIVLVMEEDKKIYDRFLLRNFHYYFQNICSFFLWHKLNLVLIYLNFLLFHFIIFAYWHLSLILIISFSNTFQIIYIFYYILFFIFYFVIIFI